MGRARLALAPDQPRAHALPRQREGTCAADAGCAGGMVAAGTDACAAAGALAGLAARSSTLPPDALGTEWPKYASASVHTKNTEASTAVERDRKFALPVAPNRLPDAP